MPIGTDFSVNASGDIRHEANTNTYTVLELHRWLQDLADNEWTASGDDVLDITSPTPSERSTDQIITLLNGYNIDDDAAEYFYGGSITQGSGATETVYSGLKVLGSVVSSATQVQVVQDKGLPYTDSPFWGTQATPFNGGGSTLCRFLVKSREWGCDIDQKQIVVQIRHYGDSYAFFNVTLGEGEAVAAVSSVDDPQNDTAQGTVTAYTHVTNTEGFQQIDIGDGNGNQPYYSKWTYGADTSGDQLKAVWEWVKDLTYTGTAKTVHGGIDGELFAGITHSYGYDGLTGTFTEDETVVWGTQITYDTLVSGPFTPGYYVRIGTSGAAGRVMYDNGSNLLIVALEDPTITLVDDDVITEYQMGELNGASGTTAAIAVTIVDNALYGGSGILLANDSSGAKHHIMKQTGGDPVDNSYVWGLTSSADCDVAGSVTGQTVTPVFLGSYVGTLIGGFGIGIDSDDLTNLDTVTDLDGDINTPPNNVTWTLGGVVADDRCLVGPKDVGDAFEFDQMTLAAALDTATETIVDVGTGNIPANTPASGTLRITLDDGRIRRQPYTSHDGDDEFTIASADYLDPDDAAIGRPVMCSYIDAQAVGTTIAYTTIYTSGPQNLRVRVRYGDASAPIKTYEGNSQLLSTGGGATASRISDA
jgi:hypothetical protein